MFFDLLNVDTRLHRKKDLACSWFKERHFDFALKKGRPQGGANNFWDKDFLMLIPSSPGPFFVCVSVQITRKMPNDLFAFLPTLNNTQTYTYKYIDGVSNASQGTTQELTLENINCGYQNSLKKSFPELTNQGAIPVIDSRERSLFFEEQSTLWLKYVL